MYSNIYKQICQQQQVPLNRTIVQGLKGQELQINVALLGVVDIVPFQILLSVCSFDAIVLYGKERARVHKSSIIVQSIEDAKSQKDIEKCYNGIANSLSINLQQPNFNLIHCQISDINLGVKDCQILGSGLSKSITIKELLILRCELTSAHLQVMSEPLQKCQSLIVLDLSHNKLKDNAGLIIGKIISVHSVRRDEMRWAEEIRGDEAPDTLALQGLCEVSLHNNEFDDKCVRDMCQFLQYDAWTKSIGLRANNIGQEGTEMLNQMLETNESLISLDLRDNPGFTLPFSKNIFDKLVRNIRLFKEGKMNEEGYDQEEVSGEQGYIDNQKAMEQLYNQYQNDPIQEVQTEEEELDDGTLKDNQEDEDQTDIQELCQKLQSENLRLQSDNVNLQMQVKQFQQQSNMKDDSQELIPRIEFLMNELAQMMDALEQRGGNASFNNVNKQMNPQNTSQEKQNAQQTLQIKKKKNNINYSR